MSDRQKIVSRLIANRDFRADYIRAKLDVLIPSQLRALRGNKTQPELAQMADMKQSRISAMETPGLVNFNRETLVRMAATHGVGMIIKFVSFSEMLEWENDYSQDTFTDTVARLNEDIDFLQPKPMQKIGIRFRRRRRTRPRSAWFPQSIGASTHDLRIQQSPSAQSQMNFQFEPLGQNVGTRELAETIKHDSPSGSVKFNLQNTATGAQPNVAAA